MPCMKVIWVDVCFAINFCADYFICLLAARLCAAPLRRGRYAAAALFGAIYAVAALFFGAAAASGAGRLAAAAVMCALAFWGERGFARLCAAFFAVSAALGGGIWALARGAGGELRLSPALLAGSFALTWAALGLLLRGSVRKREREIVPAELCFLGKRAQLRALVDTGNSLTDPITAEHVMVVAPDALRPILGDYLSIFTLSDAADVLQAADAVPALRGTLRLVPYSAVGSKGMLVAFRPDALTVAGRERRDILAALSPSASGDGFEAII